VYESKEENKGKKWNEEREREKPKRIREFQLS